MRPCVGEDVDFPAWTGSEGRPRSPKRPPTLLEDASDGRAWDFFFGLFIPEACYACATSGTPSEGVLFLRVPHKDTTPYKCFLLVSYRTLAANNRPSAARAPRLHVCRQCDGTTSHLSKIHSHEAVVGHPPSGWHPALSAAFGSSAVFTRSLVCRQMMLLSVHKLIPSCRVDVRWDESVAVSNRNSDR